MPLVSQVSQVAENGTISCKPTRLDLHLQIVISIEMKILVFQNVPNIWLLFMLVVSFEPFVAQEN